MLYSPMKPRLDILFSIWYHFVIIHVPLEQDNVNLTVLHSPDEDRDQFWQVRLQSLFTDGLLGQR